MKLAKSMMLASLVLPAALLTGGQAHSQQASFAVAVTLHSASQSAAAAQLCPGGKPLSLLAPMVRVDCPQSDKTVQAPRDTATPASGSSASLREVIVTF